MGNVEGNMSGPVMRGAVALPWSKTPSRTNGSRRNLGDLVCPQSLGDPGPRQEGRMDEAAGEQCEGSDGLVVPVKPRTKPTRAATESVEGRGTVGREATARPAPDTVPDQACHRCPPRPANRRCGEISVPAGCVRLSAGAHCGKAARWDLCGGARATRFPTATRNSRGPARGKCPFRGGDFAIREGCRHAPKPFLGPAWPDAEYPVDGGSPLGSPTAMRRSVGTIRPVVHIPFAFALLLAILAIVCGGYSSVSAQSFSWGEATPYLVFSTYLGGSTPCMDCSDVRTFAQNAASDAWGTPM